MTSMSQGLQALICLVRYVELVKAVLRVYADFAYLVRIRDIPPTLSMSCNAVQCDGVRKG